MERMVFDTGKGFEIVVTFRPKRNADESLASYWSEDAPFSYETFVSEMKRYGILNEDCEWVKYQIRGNHHTQAFHVVGCYEALQAIGCLPELSWPQVRTLFNATFKTRINNAKVLQNKAGKNDQARFLESDYFHSIFSSIPGNPREPLK